MTNALEYLAELGKYLPTIESPKFRPNLKTRIYITIFVGLLYLLLSHIYVVGLVNDFPKIYLSGAQNQAYSTILLLIGANLGTLTTLGISPIVTASILLMLLTGSKIIEVDLNGWKVINCSNSSRCKKIGIKNCPPYCEAIVAAKDYAFGRRNPKASVTEVKIVKR